MQADLTPLRADDFIPFGQSPEVVLAAATKSIQFWEMQRAQQDERRKELLKRERDDKEEMHRRAEAGVRAMSSEVAVLREENKRLKMEQDHITNETRSKLSTLVRSKRKVTELYWKLKKAWQDQHGELPDELLNEASVLGIQGSPAEFEDPSSSPGMSSAHSLQQQQQQHQQPHRESPLLIPLSTRTKGGATPLIRSVGSPFARQESPSPFARAGIASPKPASSIFSSSIAATATPPPVSVSSMMSRQPSTPLTGIGASTSSASSPFSRFSYSQPTSHPSPSPYAASSPLSSMRPNSLMERNPRPTTPASFSSKFLL